MSALSKKLRLQEGGNMAFWCPGCDEAHSIRIAPSPKPWAYSGNPETPTFTPSILTRGVRFTDKGNADHKAWVDGGCQPLPEGYTFDNKPFVCHSFVTDGKIKFLGDCTHELKDQTVALPDWPEPNDA